MKLLKKILLTLFLFILFAVGTLFIIAFAYQNEVKEYIIEKLNKNLTAKVIVDSKNIDFSCLTNFPSASLTFKNVLMLEPPIPNSHSPLQKRRDTLFYAENFSLQFNLLDIFRKNYIVKKIKAENGKVKLKVAADGSINWNVWNSSSGKTDTTASQSVFNLEKVLLNNISVFYSDYKNKNAISLALRSVKIKGEFASKKYDLSVTGEALVNHFIQNNTNYLDNKPVKMNLTLKVDNEKNLYEFTNALLHIADLKISVEGKYISSPSFINIELKGKDMDLQEVFSLLPQKYHKYISDYESDGKLYCNAQISGKADAQNFPSVKGDFGIVKGEITQLSTGIVLQNVNLHGNYYIPSTFPFGKGGGWLSGTFSAALANGTISGNLRIDDFSSLRQSTESDKIGPLISASLNANLLLSDLRHLLKVDTLWNYPVESLAGNVKMNIKYKGKINPSGKYTRSDFENMNLLGEVLLENATMKIKNPSFAFDSINGSFVLKNNNITLNSFSGLAGIANTNRRKSDFYLKGNLKNILAYSFTDDADINVEAEFQSKNFDLNQFLVNQQKSSAKDTVYKISFSPRINFTLNSNIGHLSFRKFEANNIRGIVSLRNQKLIADPLSFSSMDGLVTASGMIDGTQNNTLLITCNANLNKLNISKLFEQFEDFNQHTITHKNLKGLVTAEVQFASVWKSDLTVDENRIYVRSDVTIDKGELIKFEPLKALSKYIAVSELEDIKFSTLQNQIEIKDRKIFIPKMDINCSALNLSLWGTHSFDNSIDYHIKVAMADILFQKARKAKKENDEFGVVEEDKSGRTNLFLSMTGTVDHPIIKYDKQGAKQNLKENIAQEKQTLKQILKEEFGWFKKDTALNKMEHTPSTRERKDKTKDEGKFIIKWDEEEMEHPDKIRKEKKKKEDEDF
jgi:hypothetical protein